MKCLITTNCRRCLSCCTIQNAVFLFIFCGGWTLKVRTQRVDRGTSISNKHILYMDITWWGAVANMQLFMTNNPLQAWIMHPGNNSLSVSLKWSSTFSRPPWATDGKSSTKKTKAQQFNAGCTHVFQVACSFFIIHAVQPRACGTTHVRTPEHIHKIHTDWLAIVVVNVICRNKSKTWLKRKPI